MHLFRWRQRNIVDQQKDNDRNDYDSKNDVSFLVLEQEMAEAAGEKGIYPEDGILAGYLSQLRIWLLAKLLVVISNLL